MGIFDNFGMPGQQDECWDETEVRKTTVQDGEQTRVIWGNSRHDVKQGERNVAETHEHLLMTDDGVITSADPQDPRYPHAMGKDYKGNLVSAGNLHRCREKGCNRLVSNLCGAEYRPGHWRCTEHYRKYDLCRFVKWFISPFYSFQDEDAVEETIPVQKEVPDGREEK